MNHQEFIEELAKIYQLLDLGKISECQSKVKQVLLSEAYSSVTTSLKIDRPLQEVLLELQSQQELR